MGILFLLIQAFKGTVVNRKCHSVNGGLLKIRVPIFFMFFRYTGRVEDDGELLVCSAGQLDDSNLPLYSTQINTIIRIIQPSPLSSSVASSINIIILIISIIIVLIFIIVFVIIFAVVKQKKKKGERRSIDQSTWTSNTPSRCAVHPLHSPQCEDKYKVRILIIIWIFKY